MLQDARNAKFGKRHALLLASLVLGFLFIGTSRAQEGKEKEKAKAPELPSIAISSKDASGVEDVVGLIDEKIEAAWKDNEVIPSEYCDDYTFIRRASLDIIGRIATVEEIQKFMKDPAKTRRSLLIERLLESEEYALHWSNLWTTWLLTRSGVFGRGMYQQQMADWLKDEFAVNTKFDQLTRKLITASGKNSENGATNFILAHMGEPTPQGRRQEEGAFEMVPITSRITRLFLGTQVQCAQCHDHPFFDAVRQKHFWGVNAFLRQTERVGQLPRRRQDALMTLELKDNPSVNPKAAVFYEKRNGVVLRTRAEFLPKPGEERGTRLDAERTGVARREALADYLVEHPNYTQSIVNRMWGTFLGKGFVNPIDDFNDNNTPSHPELLPQMGERFKNYGYDLKMLIRWITHSKAYHLQSVANETNADSEYEVLFSRMLLKAMTPEQMFESLMTATGQNKGDVQARREQRERWLNTLVSNFGDDEGNEINFNGTVVQALLMMNGNDINGVVSDKKEGTMADAVKTRNALAAIRHLYLATLNRPPSPQELQLIQSKIKMRVRDKEALAPYQDLYWALLNCNEFMLNH